MHIIIMIIMSQFFVGKNDWGGFWNERGRAVRYFWSCNPPRQR